MKNTFRILLAAWVCVSVSLLVTAKGSAQSSNPAAHSALSHDIAALSCSPAPCVLPSTQASEGGSEVTDSPIVAPDGQHFLVGSTDFNCASPSALGFHLSSDGGSTWNVTCMDTIVTSKRVYWPGDTPLVAYDRTGAAYIAGLYSDSEGLGYTVVGFEKSRDGVNWSQAAAALGDDSHIPLQIWMTADTNPGSPYENNLYVSAVEELGLYSSKTQLVVGHSSDGGNHWQVAPVYPVQVGPAGDALPNLTVGKDGAVYLSWQHCLGGGKAAGCKDGRAYMVFSKSTDGGNTWTPPSVTAVVMLNNAACHCDIGGLPNTKNIRVYDYPAIAVDDSDSLYAGNLYVVLQTWTGKYLRVQLVSSADDGKTWSKPVPLAPPSDTHDQFFPWISVSNTGLVGVSWLDRRNDPANVNYQPFAAISTDGGKSFHPNVLLSTAFSNPNVNGYTDNLWMGDYTGNTWAGSNFIAAWMDSSNGVNMQAVVGGIRLK